MWSHFDLLTVYLTINGEQIETTPEHPFYTSEGVWVEAGELEIGTEIQTAEGTTGTVESVNVVESHIRMYNFTVAVAHTYFVGQGNWLVHNCGVDEALNKIIDADGNWEVVSGVDTRYGQFDVAGSATIDGKNLTLENATIFPTGGQESASVGIKGIMELTTELGKAARQRGFETLRIVGDRVFGSSSANPGHTFDRLFDLTKSIYNK